MKKSLMTLVALSFLVAVSAPAFAAEATPVQTPVVKAMKHKKVRHHKKKMKKAATPSSTPTSK